MRQLSFVICILFLMPVLTFAQDDKTKWVTEKIKSADTILLISHTLLAGSTDDAVDKNGKTVALPELIVDDKLNRTIIKEEKVLTSRGIDSLIKILTRPNKSSIITQGGCFVPRQIIVIIKGIQTSYIDLCFHCGSYETSNDLQNIPAFDSQQWIELEKYFRQQGLTYQLDEQTTKKISHNTCLLP